MAFLDQIRDRAKDDLVVQIGHATEEQIYQLAANIYAVAGQQELSAQAQQLAEAEARRMLAEIPDEALNAFTAKLSDYGIGNE